MSGKKKRLDFTVRPRMAKEELPADAESWVRGEQGAEAIFQKPPTPPQEAGPQKRLTLNLPAGLHTAFKGRCVVENITIQDKVRRLIERELAAARSPGIAETSPAS